MGDDEYEGPMENLQDCYESDMARAGRESWSYAFLGLFALFIGFVTIDSLVSSPQARTLALGVIGFCCVAVLVRYAIKWAWQAKLKNEYAKKVMLP